MTVIHDGPTHDALLDEARRVPDHTLAVTRWFADGMRSTFPAAEPPSPEHAEVLRGARAATLPRRGLVDQDTADDFFRQSEEARRPAVELVFEVVVDGERRRMRRLPPSGDHR
jgi:hypothetical protein